ncbi:dihydrolipoyl dehydrogenase [Lederbergia citri]|uniref:Dihydrolipoyl dehydrogenase n=1 Tax=Lederbergia citri TaxID=2833580 RepID=A0A942TJC8_9BACI|nr:dihydrolipoyl dehydrogenase [Lederbergia citri]MBS4197122.1 dihydrolipoyl dehydrogenase [Lederbergia citri]
MGNSDAKKHVHTLVIGSGPGGYTVAAEVAKTGKSVAIVERDQIGGVCTNTGCIPSKALIAESHKYEQAFNYSKQYMESSLFILPNFKEVQKVKETVVEKQSTGVKTLLSMSGVEIIRGEARFNTDTEVSIHQANSVTTIKFDNCVIATGSRSISLKNMPFTRRILSSKEALSLEEIPERLVVVGGGYIGIELGQMYAKMGSQVTILEAGRSILPEFDSDLIKPVEKKLLEKKVDIQTNAFVQEIVEKQNQIEVYYKVDGEEKRIFADFALITIGRRPNTDGSIGLDKIGISLTDRGHVQVDSQYKTSLPHIFAIGDIVEGPALAHKATYEANIVAGVINGKNSIADYQAIPLVVFSDPEIASVGENEAILKSKGIEIVTGKSRFMINGRASALQATEGFVKLVAGKKSGTLLAASIVCVEASSLISELALAVEMGATVEDIILTIHPHPTLSEVVVEAAKMTFARIEKA